MLSDIQNVIADCWEVTGPERNQLIEKQGNKTISEVNISTSGQYVLYKFERNGVIQIPYFTDIKNVKKICDYVLFTMSKDTLYVLIFELKNGNGCPIEQLKASESLSTYFIETACRVARKYPKSVEYRRIGITNKSVKMNLKTGKVYNNNKYVQLTSKSKIDIKLLCE